MNHYPATLNTSTRHCPQKLQMSPLPGSPENCQSSANAAAAALARANQAPKQKPTTQLVAEHDRRQAFRRLIDPGILRPNSKEQASSSLKVNLQI